MLVFISDLHFVDGTAGKHNVPTNAFEGVLGDLGNHARKANAEKAKIVFLGDIFDVIRTEKWFEIDESERPWGDKKKDKEIEQHALEILNSVILDSQNTFDLFKRDLQHDYNFPCEVEQIYIPGNHDRLCNKYESLRVLVRENLGIKGKKAGEKFDHQYLDPEYGVFARHGHEFDGYNYEGGNTYTFDDYMQVPLGDPITTELVAKLPWTIKKRLEEDYAAEYTPKEIEQIYTNFQDIENVRPLEATVDWLFHQVQKHSDLRKIIEDVIDDVVREFEKLTFVKDWYERHDKWYRILDEADKVQLVLDILKRFKITSTGRLLSLIDKVREIDFGQDKHAEAAVREFSSLDTNIRYIVYGHTHDPKQVPLQVVGRPPEELKRVYLNTGTWRSRHRRCEQGDGFIDWKNLTYVIFYNKDEVASSESDIAFPTFETWSGALKEA